MFYYRYKKHKFPFQQRTSETIINKIVEIYNVHLQVCSAEAIIKNMPTPMLLKLLIRKENIANLRKEVMTVVTEDDAHATIHC
jgi:hypothetical protein